MRPQLFEVRSGLQQVSSRNDANEGVAGSGKIRETGFRKISVGNSDPGSFSESRAQTIRKLQVKKWLLPAAAVVRLAQQVQVAQWAHVAHLAQWSHIAQGIHVAQGTHVTQHAYQDCRSAFSILHFLFISSSFILVFLSIFRF